MYINLVLDNNKIVLFGIVALILVSVIHIASPELTGFVTTTPTCNSTCLSPQVCTNGVCVTPSTCTPACAAQEICQNGRCVYQPPSTCISTAPSGIVLHPNYGTIVKGTDTKVSWSLQSWGVNCNGNKNYYTVQIADASPYSGFRTVANQLTSYQNYYTLSGSPGKTYYWRVIAKNGAYQLVSGYSSFTVTPTTGSCSNGIKDGQETDVDCGASCLYNQCTLGRKCNTISDCKAGLVCTSGICVNVPLPTCTDTDGGNNILVKGTLSFKNFTQSNVVTDFCDISGQLTEYYCTSANSYKWTISSCPIGLTCRDGACVKSSAPVCGNKICETGEKDQLKGCYPPVVGQACDPILIKGTCPVDCQTLTPVCGNKICELYEKCFNAPIVCPPTPAPCASAPCFETCPQDCQVTPPTLVYVNIPSSFSLIKDQSAKVTNYQDMKINLVGTFTNPVCTTEPCPMTYIKEYVKVVVSIPGGCGPNADPRCLGPPSYSNEFTIREGESAAVLGVKLNLVRVDDNKAGFGIEFPPQKVPVCGNKICESGESTVCSTCPRGAPECAAPFCIPGTCPQDCPAPTLAPNPSPTPTPTAPTLTTTATGRAVLNPQVRHSLTVTFLGNPQPRINSGIIGGLRQSILGEASIVTRYASLNELNKELNVNEYVLREVNLDDNLYTYSVVLGPGIDVREAAQKLGSDFYVTAIG